MDDEPDVCEVIAVSFKLLWSGATVLSANTGADGIALVRTETPDVIVLDIGLPDMNGFEVCRRIREFTSTPLLVLTVRSTELGKVKGLGLGADDYITKPFSLLELQARVRAILRRHRSPHVAVSESPYESRELLIDFDAREVRLRGEPVSLPPIEYGILYHLVRNAHRVLSHSELLAKVWGRDYVDRSDYLKVHVRRLRSKLERDPSHPRMILTERAVGYRFIEPE